MAIGIPDIIGHIGGRFFAIELKREKNPSKTHAKLQDYILSKIGCSGASAVKSDNYEHVVGFLIALSESVGLNIASG